MPGRVLSGMYFEKTPGTDGGLALKYASATVWLVPKFRYVKLNHALSLAIGPPSDVLKSQIFSTAPTFVREFPGLYCRSPARLLRRLSACQEPFVKLPYDVPRKVFPPSLGIMLMRIPPWPISAESAPV